MDHPIELAELEQRLRRSADTLDRQVTVSSELHRRLIQSDAGDRARRARRIQVTTLRLAMAAGLVVAANLGIAYFSPGYARALASAPLIGAVSRPVLQSAGLTGAEFTPLDGVARSSGHTVQLISGYADPVRTVLFVSVDGKQPALGSKTSHDYELEAYLTDQFGHRYNGASTGNGWLEFQPLKWPASAVGARLTLHVANLMQTWNGQEIAGDWTIHLTLFEQTTHSRDLAPPQAVSSGGLEYRITSIRLSYLAIKLRWSVGGPAVSAWRTALVPPGPGQAPTFPDFARFTLYDPHGRPVESFSGWGFTGEAAGSTGPVHLDLDGVLPEPGHYIFQFGTNDPTARVSFDVPNP
jgi:hypothetical protein